MIKASDLRIGNWIEFDYSDYPTIPIKNEIGQVTATTIIVIDDGNNDYEPKGIPLTDEWLLKLGFAKKAATKEFRLLEMPYWANNAVLLFFNESNPNSFLSGYASMRDGIYETVTFDWHCNSVHQLQNLYFALTGTELEIK